MLSESKCRKLVKLVEERPAIYNPRLTENKNRALIQFLWEEIATEMDIPSHICKWKWGNLRKAYTKYITNGAAARGGSSFLSDCMGFVREFIGIRRRAYTTYFGEPHYPGPIPDPNTTNLNIIDEETSRSNSIVPTFLPPSPHEMISPSHEVIEERQADTTTMEKSKHMELGPCSPLEQHNENQDLELESEKKHPIITFVDSILHDIHELSEKRKRKFKQEVLISLNHLLDQEMELASQRKK